MGWMNNLFGNKSKPVAYERRSDSMETGGIKAVVVSDLGNIRTNNEDMGLFFKIADENMLREKGYMLIVADGMGGHNAGEVASRMATDIICREYYNQKSSSVEKNLEKSVGHRIVLIYPNEIESAPCCGEYHSRDRFRVEVEN
jgi:hypothetical protein